MELNNAYNIKKHKNDPICQQNLTLYQNIYLTLLVPHSHTSTKRIITQKGTTVCILYTGLIKQAMKIKGNIHDLLVHYSIVG